VTGRPGLAQLLWSDRIDGSAGAICAREAVLTYGEYRRQVLALAGHLTSAGIGRGDRVMLCLHKDERLPVWIFGVLASGACYVPIEVTCPRPRLALILDDAAPAALVTTASRLAELFAGVDASRPRQIVVAHLTRAGGTLGIARVVAMEEALGAAPADGPAATSSADPAYILFTSGSTGRPKGVLHTQASALAFVEWAAREAELTAGDRVSQHAPPSFDLSIFDFFSTAKAGARLVLVPSLMGHVGKHRAFILDHGITVWYSVPSALLGAFGSGSAPSLRTSALRHVIFAGEPIPRARLVELAADLPPGCRISNWYGPTETNVCTYHRIGAEDLRGPGPIPIGHPCTGVEVRLTASAAGGRGELLVKSPMLMAGYWDAVRAGPDRSTAGWYATGDLVSRDERGALVFHARADRMLKLQGYRIQPEEVERVLRDHPEVRDAVVTLFREEGHEQDRLGAVVESHAPAVAPGDLRAHCARALPPYMVPARIAVARELPRGPRGKLDVTAAASLLVGETARTRR
jgi:amino acid adenylation domain-containing protein